jgi:hypothetical protein
MSTDVSEENIAVAICFQAGFLPHFSTLKMEAICSSEKSVDTQRTTRRDIPEDGTLLYSLLQRREDEGKL